MPAPDAGSMSKGRQKCIGLLSATHMEGGLIRRALEKCRRQASPLNACYAGALDDRPVVYAESGIGKANAAHAVTLLLHYYSPSLIVNFGIGGAYPGSGLSVGDIAVSTKEVYGDEGVAFSWGVADLREIGIPVLKKGRKVYFNEFPFDKNLVRKVMTALGNHADYRVKKGTFVTVSACTGFLEKAERDEKRFKALCENMEGAAVAHMCALYRVPLVEIRGISNIVEDRDTSAWDMHKAVHNCQGAVRKFLEKIHL